MAKAFALRAAPSEMQSNREKKERRTIKDKKRKAEKHRMETGANRIAVKRRMVSEFEHGTDISGTTKKHKGLSSVE